MTATTGPASTTRPLRVMTYNVHSCIGLDRKLSIQRVADVIASAEPDIVALQELDEGRARTDRQDQAHAIAEQLGMRRHFFPAIEIEEERYGDAVLSRWPMALVHAGRLPGIKGLPRRLTPQPRGALWVEIDWAGHRLQCINTHLGLREKERWLQVNALLGSRWLAAARGRGPTMLCGDLNAVASSRVCRKLAESLHDAQTAIEGHRPVRTFQSRYPVLRIDHVYLGPEFVTRAVRVLNDATARVASDHLPLIVDVELRAWGGETSGHDGCRPGKN